MELDTSTLMMIFFVIFMILSIWKIWAFMPNKELKDDDTTKESQEELLDIILDVIKRAENSLTPSELHEKVKEHERFDKEHYWRFNLNRLNQLLNLHYLNNPHLNSIDDIKDDLSKSL